MLIGGRMKLAYLVLILTALCFDASAAEKTNYTALLDNKIKEVCPIYGVSVGVEGNSSSVTISFKDEATKEQKIEAQAVVDAFDWNQEIVEPLTAEERLTILEARVEALER